ncbi:MAG: hypothetical protein JWN16_2576 [Alphaproteobacteria bacterium]|nr:hypothetical protein [Alphaproteobacteria bacterium]
MALEFTAEIPGAAELCDQFGGFPSFADAKAEFSAGPDGTGSLKVWSYFIGRDGNYDVGKPIVVIFSFDGIATVSLTKSDGAIYLDNLTVGKVDGLYETSWESAYGADGVVHARQMRITLQSGDKAED